ncbi:MAG: class IV adenylate cyclase [Balneolaceae bacterium]|nr:class IV adenylate cyclase [Balneolaceae bacterium]
MPIQNVEIKARCSNPDKIQAILKEHDADFKGTDHQIDTYFNIPDGRLKLREGTIENNLIYYKRSNTKQPKTSEINLVPMDHPKAMKKLLSNALGVWKVVDKQRKIYFIDNVKFHIDKVEQLGSFVEIEAIDEEGTLGEARLREQCNHYLQLFDISDKDLVAVSYSDLLDEQL